MFSVRFWGVRGSIPCPGPNTAKYGGNTSCLEIRADERLIIVDLGTGLKPLGDWLLANDLKKNGKIDADVFVTHTHWDHIMGFPSFAPVFVPAATLRIRGPVPFEKDSLESILGVLFSYHYWPICQKKLAANINYEEIQETVIDLGGGLKVTTKFLNHTLVCLAYRFEYQGKSIVTAFDHEPYLNIFPDDPDGHGYNENAVKEGELAAAEESRKLIDFFRGADILIHDAQYIATEYAPRLGWGHSEFGHAMDNAANAGVKKLVFYHHEPKRTDDELERLEKNCLNNTAPQLFMAREMMTLEA